MPQGARSQSPLVSRDVAAQHTTAQLHVLFGADLKGQCCDLQVAVGGWAAGCGSAGQHGTCVSGLSLSLSLSSSSDDPELSSLISLVPVLLESLSVSGAFRIGKADLPCLRMPGGLGLGLARAAGAACTGAGATAGAGAGAGAGAAGGGGAAGRGLADGFGRAWESDGIGSGVERSVHCRASECNGSRVYPLNRTTPGCVRREEGGGVPNPKGPWPTSLLPSVNCIFSRDETRVQGRGPAGRGGSRGGGGGG